MKSSYIVEMLIAVIAIVIVYAIYTMIMNMYRIENSEIVDKKTERFFAIRMYPSFLIVAICMAAIIYIENWT